MGSELLEFGFKLRKGVIFTTRWCLRSVCSHPFLVGMLCFLVFLYRSSPFIFSLLVSTSPVLICTAVLLGTILSFGQPNIPEIEVEDKTLHEAVSLKTGVSEDALVVEKNDSYYVERYSEKREEAEQLIVHPSLSADELSEVHNSEDTALLIEERSREIDFGNGEIYEENRDSADTRYKQKAEWKEEGHSDGETMENHYASIPKHSESDDERSDAESFGSEKVNVDSLDSPPRSPWTKVMDREEEERNKYEEEEEDGALDSGSDRAESSSPDASMADILPMLDELHPLLDEDAPQPAHMSANGSYAASDRSSSSSTSSHKSDDESENHENSEVADDDNEDGEEDEEEEGDKEKEIKSAISWTDEDQKNLMDLGTSEIERNQRLENLILRRRARQNMSILQERNLIDLESFNLPFSVAPISTNRQNPFDLLHDSYDDSGLPPIPGSAPSVLLQRRNPFDIPYDSSEEKPDLVGDGLQDLTTSHPRETFFRRHESFNARPSFFAPSRQERQLRPYFVPEQMISEESSSPFQRQLSELSDSKVSSVPDTESVVSVENAEDRNLIDEDNLQELEAIHSIKESSNEGTHLDHELISMRVENAEDRNLTDEDNPQELEAIDSIKESTNEGIQVDPELISMREELIEEDVPPEPELSSKIEHVSDVGHGSQSSEDEDSLDGRIDKGDVEDDELEVQSGDIDTQYEEGSADRPVEVQATEYLSNFENVERRRYGSESSSSSLSEVSERVFSVREVEDLSILDGRRDDYAEEPIISSQTSLESTGPSIAVVDDITLIEPVYDLSPTSVRRNFSSSSISSDVHAETDLGLPPVLVKRTVSFIERESEGSSQVMDKGVSDLEMLVESSTLQTVNEHESGPTDVVNAREEDDINLDFSVVDRKTESKGVSAADGITSHESVHSESSVEASIEENLMDQHTQGQVPVSSSDENIHALVKHSENPDQVHMREEVIKEDVPLKSAESEHSLIAGIDSQVQISEQPLEVQSTVKHSAEEEEPIEKAETNAHSPNSDSDVSLEALDKQISTPSADGNESFFYDKPAHEPTFEHLNEVKARDSLVESSDEVLTIQEMNMPEVQEPDHDIFSYINSPLTPDFISIPSMSSDAASSHVAVQTIVEDVDEIKEIDGLLSELDSVGDFSINQQVSVSDELEKHVDYVGESSLSAEADTSTARIVNSVENNTIENEMHSVNSREDIDIYEEDFKQISDIKTSETDRDEHIDISGTEFIGRDVQVNEATHSSLVTHNYEDNNYGIPEVEVQTSAEVDSLFNKAESTNVLAGGAEISHHVQVEIDTTSGMPELEARTPEDITLAFKQISDMEIETPPILEPPQDGLVLEELVAKQSKDEELHRISDAIISTDNTPILEVRSIEDPKLDYEKVADGNLHVVESTETQGTSSELHVAEPVPLESTSLPQNQALDGNAGKLLKPNSSDVSVQIEADKVESSMDKPSTVQEINVVTASKPDHEVKETEDLHSVTSAKGKGKISKSSSSSSSSSSESSSSDSDRE